MAKGISAISLKINPPTGATPPGRGFYQLEEDALYVPVGEHDPKRRFFSYLESERIRFDVDRSGRLMLIEVDFARRHWTLDESLVAPPLAEPADIRWLDFRATIPDPELVTDSKRGLLLARFATSENCHWYYLAEKVLVQADENNSLAALMVTAIDDDLAGREIAAFREQIRRDSELVVGSRLTDRP